MESTFMRSWRLAVVELSPRSDLRRLWLAAAFAALAGIADVRADSGGGSAALFSLDPTSPSLALFGYGPADIFVDDARDDGVLTRALPASGLRLVPGDILTGLSGPSDNGIPVMYEYGNAMNWPHLRYQFSVDRDAADNFTSGSLPLSYEFAVFFPAITRSAAFALQFPGDAAADIFDNTEVPGVPIMCRFNWQVIDESGPPPPSLELIGSPAPVIDNISGLASVGTIGGGPDADNNGELDVGSVFYFTLGPGSPSRANGATIYRMAGTNTPAGVPTVYATPAQLGLSPGDEIDALSVWDRGVPGVFDGPDGVVLSFAPGSPFLATHAVLPGDMNGVMHDAGSIFLIRPGSAGPRVVAALQRQYFSLAGGNLDAIMCLDPRENTNCFAPPLSPPTVPAGEIVLSTSLAPLVPGGMTVIYVGLTDAAGLPDGGAIKEFSVAATPLEGASVARVVSAGTPYAGPVPPDLYCLCFTQCNEESGPPCGASATFGACNLDLSSPYCTTPVTFTGWDTCLGGFHVLGLVPGRSRYSIATTITTKSGMLVTFPPSEVVINVIVDCNGNGVADAVDIAKGTSTDVNGNGVPDDCESVPLWDTGAPHAVLMSGSPTYLGYSSGNLPGMPQRWAAVPFRIPSPGAVITRIDADWLISPGYEAETVNYVIWQRSGMLPPGPGDERANGVLGPYGPGVDDPRTPDTDDWLHFYYRMNILLPGGDYYFTMYAAGIGAGNTTGFSDSPWLTGGDLQPVDLEQPFLWRSASFPTPGFEPYDNPAIEPMPAQDPDDRWNPSFAIYGLVSAVTCRGDTNCDGVVSFADINPFVQALGNLSAWQAAHPGCPWQNCDVNADGVVSFADINPFVAKLSSPGPCP